jgi:regulator of replication initiation timing
MKKIADIGTSNCTQVIPEVRSLQLEVERLKKNLAQQALKLEVEGISEKRRDRKPQSRSIFTTCGFSNCSNGHEKA